MIYHTNYFNFMLKRILLFTFTICTLAAIGQQKPMLPYAIQKGTLNEQFINLSNLSRSQSVSFKLIRRTNLEIVRKNVLDSVSQYKQQITTLNKNSSSSTATIKSLQDSVTRLDAALQVEKKLTNSISFLGIDFAKGTYHTMVWILIAVLALLFIVTLASFRKAKVDTVAYKKTADEFQEELQALRKKTMEREQLLKRQLLDEQMKRNS
ncbi:hypothetical protein FM107_00435 [Sphingobacterium sp. JB170]|nr:hypothetical protein FM107_00435 [Sphingobacterium sp. JB170]